jgi:hypothetical protein
LIQALFFSIPRIIWQSFNDKIGLPLESLVDAANKYEKFDGDKDRNAGMNQITYTFFLYKLIFFSCAIYF